MLVIPSISAVPLHIRNPRGAGQPRNPSSPFSQLSSGFTPLHLGFPHLLSGKDNKTYSTEQPEEASISCGFALHKLQVLFLILISFVLFVSLLSGQPPGNTFQRILTALNALKITFTLCHNSTEFTLEPPSIL